MVARLGARPRRYLLLASALIIVLLLACTPVPTPPSALIPETSQQPTAVELAPTATSAPDVSIVTDETPIPTSVEEPTIAALDPTSTALPVATATRQSIVYAPILMYHSFDDAVDLYSVRPSRFREQIRALKAAGFNGVTLSQVADAMDFGAPLPPHPIAITMDDGRANQTFAVKILTDEGFTATLFIPSGWHEITRDYIENLDREGFEIGGHTVWHVNLARNPAKRPEIRQGKKTIEDWLGHPVGGFAYPYGAYRPADVAELKQVGFRYAVTIQTGVALRADDRYHWPRILVSSDDPRGLVDRLQTMLREATAGRERRMQEAFG